MSYTQQKAFCYSQGSGRPCCQRQFLRRPGQQRDPRPPASHKDPGATLRRSLRAASALYTSLLHRRMSLRAAHGRRASARAGASGSPYVEKLLPLLRPHVREGVIEHEANGCRGTAHRTELARLTPPMTCSARCGACCEPYRGRSSICPLHWAQRRR